MEGARTHVDAFMKQPVPTAFETYLVGVRYVLRTLGFSLTDSGHCPKSTDTQLLIFPFLAHKSTPPLPRDESVLPRDQPVCLSTHALHFGIADPIDW